MSFMNVVRRSLGFEETKERKNDLSSNAGSTFYDDITISPEIDYYDNSSFEIMLLKPKTIDDINYVIDQIIEEKNPVILDLAFLEKESPANFKLASDKINYMRSNFNAQVLLLSHTNTRNLVIISPENINLVKK